MISQVVRTSRGKTWSLLDKQKASQCLRIYLRMLGRNYKKILYRRKSAHLYLCDWSGAMLCYQERPILNVEELRILFKIIFECVINNS